MARLKLLSALDTAKTQYYHFKAIMIAGIGLFTDAYHLFSITLIIKMIERIHYSPPVNEAPPVVASTLVAVALLGIAIGQRVASASVDDADVAWRLILMLGSIPAAMTYYWRMMMPETATYTALTEQNVIRAAKEMERVLDVSLSQIAEEHPLPPTAHPYTLLSREFLRRHGRDLFACSSTWFLFDIVFYSQIYNIYFKKDHYNDVYQEAIHVAWIQAVIPVCSTIPGYFFSVYFIDKWGRSKSKSWASSSWHWLFLLLGFPVTPIRPKRIMMIAIMASWSCMGLLSSLPTLGPTLLLSLTQLSFSLLGLGQQHVMAFLGPLGKLGQSLGPLGFFGLHINRRTTRRGTPKELG
ncbi:hypothetical protein Fmac_026967 [Flemingia macrophylla]|uniref:Uncharacterized protein n=1 Tax=Flemingia macrophylla TaxID=520843 RepID=A0ABD1LGC6_9FABA